jgi:RNA polymerase sigma factor (sigma-70 family)
MTALTLPTFAPPRPTPAPWTGLVSLAVSLLTRAVRGASAAGRQAAAAPEPPLSPPDVERFRRLLLPYMDDAYGFALHLCRDSAVAEDLAQDAFLRALRGFAGYRGGDAKAWLLAIVRSSFLTWAKSRRDWSALVDPDGAEAAEQAPSGEDSAEDELVRQAGVADLRLAIDALPQPFRETLVLRELQEMNYRQIAEITGAPIGTVMSRLARARALLIAALRPETATP